MTLAATSGEEEDIASFGKDAEPLPRDDNGDLKELKINQIVQHESLVNSGLFFLWCSPLSLDERQE